ncbi:interferon alpha/beta receptor 2-like [Thalassophryne amazonica]|uniref:interferon alpha/beta receptor 2-like n=1 Tax=Thalassophryne amazonica TaxID=390379 RepID=UPI0014712D91|nr:interferon alpha/beta receptor 2-like [Thalassophryne amazonica]
MGLWRPLLLHLHLAVCISLPAPFNVSISSFNMEHTLSYQPGPGTPNNTHFSVHIIRLRSKNSWRPVNGCLELTVRQTCNLTKAFKQPLDHYRARVQAFTPTQKSNWTMSAQFQPLSDTVLGPPDVYVSGCGNCLLVKVSVPTTRAPQQNEQLRKLYRDLDLLVRRTRDGAQFRLKVHYKEESVVSYLQPGVEYCVVVTVKSVFTSNSVPSKPHCAFTSPPQNHSSSVYIVLGLVGTFCLLVLVIGLLFGSSQRALKSCLFLRAQNHEAHRRSPTVFCAVCTHALSSSSSGIYKHEEEEGF